MRECPAAAASESVRIKFVSPWISTFSGVKKGFGLRFRAATTLLFWQNAVLARDDVFLLGRQFISALHQSIIHEGFDADENSLRHLDLASRAPFGHGPKKKGANCFMDPFLFS